MTPPSGSPAGWWKPEESGADVPFSHPFGFDWEFGIAVEKSFEGFVSPANVNKEEEEGSPNENGIALADQLWPDQAPGGCSGWNGRRTCCRRAIAAR